MSKSITVLLAIFCTGMLTLAGCSQDSESEVSEGMQSTGDAAGAVNDAIF